MRHTYHKPWTVSNHQDACHFVINAPERWVSVVQVNGELNALDQRVVVQQMATAPELLDALDDCALVLDSLNRHIGGSSHAVKEVLEKARAAIDKATQPNRVSLPY